ncbi:MAG: MFS transporter [Alphaproteobacteria bacterium]|nr:MFS transporter [Alphaproteobacteria bacterium]
MTPARLPLLQYGFLALPLAFAGMPLYLHAPDFYAAHHGVPLTLLGVMLLTIRFLDAFADPLLGVISDRLGKHRLSLMIGGAALMAGGFWLLFHPLPGHELACFVLGMTLATLAYSHLSINLGALGGLWDDGAQARTRIAMAREGFGLAGLMLASAVPTLLMRVETAETAYHHFSLLLLALLVLALPVFALWFRSVLPGGAQSAPSAGMLWEALSPHKRLYVIYGISVLASAVPAVLVLSFIRDRLGAEAWGGAFLLLYFLCAIAGMPVWQKLAQRWGARKAWLAGMLLSICGFVFAYWLRAGDLAGYAVVCAVTGLALGAELALPAALLAERTDMRHATAQYAVFAFLSKLALGLAAGLALPLLESQGFRPGANNAAEALQALSIAYTLLPCALKSAAALLLWRWMKLSSEESNHVHKTNHLFARGGSHVV